MGRKSKFQFNARRLVQGQGSFRLWKTSPFLYNWSNETQLITCFGGFTPTVLKTLWELLPEQYTLGYYSVVGGQEHLEAHRYVWGRAFTVRTFHNLCNFPIKFKVETWKCTQDLQPVVNAYTDFPTFIQYNANNVVSTVTNTSSDYVAIGKTIVGCKFSLWRRHFRFRGMKKFTLSPGNKRCVKILQKKYSVFNSRCFTPSNTIFYKGDILKVVYAYCDTLGASHGTPGLNNITRLGGSVCGIDCCGIKLYNCRPLDTSVLTSSSVNNAGAGLYIRPRHAVRPAIMAEDWV